MQKLILTIVLLATAASFLSCSSKIEKIEKSDGGGIVVATKDDLPACSEFVARPTAWVEDERRYYGCNQNEAWVPLVVGSGGALQVYDANSKLIGIFVSLQGMVVKLSDDKYISINPGTGQANQGFYNSSCYFTSTDCSGECIISTYARDHVVILPDGSMKLTPDDAENLGSMIVHSSQTAASCQTFTQTISNSWIVDGEDYTPPEGISFPLDAPLIVK